MKQREKIRKLYDDYQPCNAVSPSGRLCIKQYGHGGLHMCQGIPTRGTIVWDDIKTDARSYPKRKVSCA